MKFFLVLNLKNKIVKIYWIKPLNSLNFRNEFGEDPFGLFKINATHARQTRNLSRLFISAKFTFLFREIIQPRN